MSELTNSTVLLKSRPGRNGQPTYDNFQLSHPAIGADWPTPTTGNGSILIENCWLSIDPAIRCCMNEDDQFNYLRPWQLGRPVAGLAGIGRVVRSTNDAFLVGDFVCNYDLLEWPWQQYISLTGEEVSQLGLRRLDVSAVDGRVELYLSVLGVNGLTSLIGIEQAGCLEKWAGRGVDRPVFLVNAAAGSCGSIAGSIAKSKGCLVIGIAGGREKCQTLEKELNFDGSIDYRPIQTEHSSDEDRREALCRQLGDVLQRLNVSSIHCYFDNVGGWISDAVFEWMADESDVILCGQISSYNSDLPYPPPLSERSSKILSDRRVRRERFLVLRYRDQFEAAGSRLAALLKAGQLKPLQTVYHGLERAGPAFVDMMRGGNVGKMLVDVRPVSSLLSK